MKRRVAITGIGMITPIGGTVAESWDNLVKGVPGTSLLENIIDIDKVDVKIGGQIKGYDPAKYFQPRDSRQYDFYTQFGLIATEEAIKDSGILDSGMDHERIGALVSSGIGGLQSLLLAYSGFEKGGQKDVSLFTIPKMISNILSGLITMKYDLRGVSYSIVSACTSSLHALGEGYHKIAYGLLDGCVCGGAEAPINAFSLAAFSNMKALSKKNENPSGASCPYDKRRDGFIMGEGAGTLILEEWEHAVKRGAKIYGEIVGYGASSDAHHITAPHPEGIGAASCMTQAVKEAGISLESIGYINTHGTSTPVGDIAETKAVKKVFGDHAYKLCISSNKSMIGHLLGAAGAVEAIFTALTVKNGVIPPTINLLEPDPDCDLDYVPNKAVERKVEYALSNSFGFGGQNGTIAIKRV